MRVRLALFKSMEELCQIYTHWGSGLLTETSVMGERQLSMVTMLQMRSVRKKGYITFLLRPQRADVRARIRTGIFLMQRPCSSHVSLEYPITLSNGKHYKMSLILWGAENPQPKQPILLMSMLFCQLTSGRGGSTSRRDQFQCCGFRIGMQF